MFNGASKSQGIRPVKRLEASDNSVTILTSGCHFSGKLYCKGSTRIGGVVEGEIVSEGVLIIEQHAQIKAKIVADEVIIHGVVEGKLEARLRLELCQTCRFIGDIKTSCLVIQEGAIFSGRSSMKLDACDFDDDDMQEFATPVLDEHLGELSKKAPDISIM